MPLQQDRVVLGAHVVAESAWVFALAGVVGALAGFGSSPQSWYAVVGILGLSVVLRRMVPRGGGHAGFLYALTAVVGLAAVYASVMVQVEPGQVRPAWAVQWIVNDGEGGYTSRGVFGAVLGLVLWWRGVRVAGNEFPADDLSFTFRVGMVVLVGALIYDLNTVGDLSTFPMVFLFFGSALIGLSAGHLLEESRHSAGERTWPKAIGMTVAAITLFGLLVALVNRGMLSFLSTSATTALEALARGVLWAVIVPAAFLFDAIVGWLIGLFGVFEDTGESDEREFNAEVQGFLETLQEEQGAASEGLVTVIQIIEWALVAVVAVVAALTLGRAFRRVLRGRRRGTEGRRDSMAEGADHAADVARLALRLVPDVLKRPSARGYRVPDGPAGIVEAFRLYYDMLDAAEEYGVSRRKHDTPTEFQGRLEGMLPSGVVRPSTRMFNLAIYANVPAEHSRIRRLRESLRAATARIGGVPGRRYSQHEQGCESVGAQ